MGRKIKKYGELIMGNPVYIYIGKRNGPNTEFCAAPCFTCTHLKDNLLGLPPFNYIL
jgi:hypothetical protein